MSNGSGTSLFLGRNNQGNARRVLVAFDLSEVVPVGSTIVSVTLQMHLTKTRFGPFDADLHRVLADWGEGASDALANEGKGITAEAGDATWFYRFFDTDEWATAGGEFEAESSGIVTLEGAGLYTWGSTDAMVEDVQAWADEPANNFGWIITGDESSAQTSKRFASTQSSSETSRPTLTVEFTPGS